MQAFHLTITTLLFIILAKMTTCITRNTGPLCLVEDEQCWLWWHGYYVFCFYSKGLKLQNNINSRQIPIHSSSIIIFVEGHQRFEIPQGRIKDFLMIAKFFLMDTFSGMLYRQRWSFWGFELTPPLLIFWLIAKFFLMDIFSGPKTTMIIANLGAGGLRMGSQRKD